MIPREVRSLFKSKAKASKIIRKSTSASRILNVRRKIMSIELQLEQHYKNWKYKKERDIFDKAKINKNVLYAYIKRKEATKNKIGPFKGDKSDAEMLREQYESVFSVPNQNYIISHPEAFFAECDDCNREIVHICEYDYDYHYEPNNH